MTTFATESTLRARFALFDEGSTGYLRPHELANAFRSLGWNDINTYHCDNLMQTHFGVGSRPLTFNSSSSKTVGNDSGAEAAAGGSRDEQTLVEDGNDENDHRCLKSDAEDEEVSEQEEPLSPVTGGQEAALPQGENEGNETEENDEEAEAEEEGDQEHTPLNDQPCYKINVDQFLHLARLVAVPKDSALECYKSFTVMDFTQSGILSEADLDECAMRVHGADMPAKLRARIVRSVMRVADVNEDGLLSLPEYRGAAAKGGAGTEDGPLDLAFFVVDQPPNATATRVGEKRRVSGASSSAAVNNASFTSNRSRTSRRGSNAASTSAYPHKSVVNTIPGYNNNAYAEEQEGSKEGNYNDETEGLSTPPPRNKFVNEDEEDSSSYPRRSETFNFEGINVTFTDGQISKEEVAAFFIACGDLLSGEDFDRWFAVEDDDEDGFLTEEQFRSTLEIFLGEGDGEDAAAGVEDETEEDYAGRDE